MAFDDDAEWLTQQQRLAFTTGEAGDLAGAISQSRKLLDYQLRVLGPDHPDTLTTRNNLGYRPEDFDMPALNRALAEQSVAGQRNLGRKRHEMMPGNSPFWSHSPTRFKTPITVIPSTWRGSDELCWMALFRPQLGSIRVIHARILGALGLAPGEQ